MVNSAGSYRGRKEMFYLMTHSTQFIYGYMVSDIWLRTILIVRKETCCRNIGYSFRLTARVLLYAPSHRQDSTYHGLCYTSCGALAGTRNSSMGPPHEGSIRQPIAPWVNALTTELHLAPLTGEDCLAGCPQTTTDCLKVLLDICFSCWGVIKHSCFTSLMTFRQTTIAINNEASTSITNNKFLVLLHVVLTLEVNVFK